MCSAIMLRSYAGTVRSANAALPLGPMLEQSFVDAGITLDELGDSERSAFASKVLEVHDELRAGTTSQGKALLDEIKSAPSLVGQ
jgi:hypothetical protein